MTLVTLLWSVNATVAVMLAGVCALAWLADRRDMAYAMFCVVALGTAACAPFEVGMMHATTAAEYGQWVRWYHIPLFPALVGTVLFARFYLGTGRSWLLWTIIAARVFVLLANFIVQPNFHFHQIIDLDRIAFLGDQVAVVGSSVPRSWQWLASASMFLIIVFLIDAAIQRWRQGGSGSRRKALMVSLAITVPLIFNGLASQLVIADIVQVPISSTLWFLGTLVIVSWELGREFLLNRRVRLQLSELQGELAQVERVNIMGQLVSGLAHELAQPLSAMRINADVVERCLRSTPPDLQELRETVADIHKDSIRAAEVIDRLRALYKRGGVEPQSLALNDVVQDVLALLRPEAASRRVVLESNLKPALPRVLADRVHISHVLLNLIVNAIDAVQSSPEGRRHVVVEARVTDSREMETIVKDSGPGIPDERLESIFTPFFTTKAEGLGVGLALSRSIIDTHGGRLWAKNDDTGTGATFRFTLPLA